MNKIEIGLLCWCATSIGGLYWAFVLKPPRLITIILILLSTISLMKLVTYPLEKKIIYKKRERRKTARKARR